VLDALGRSWEIVRERRLADGSLELMRTFTEEDSASAW
jgi:hypothetical protein